MANSMRSASSSDFDWSQLSQLAGNDADFAQELLTIFLEDARNSLLDLEKAIASQHAKTVEEVAHSLRGASANVGASALAAAARQLEESARGGNLNPAPRLLQQLAHHCRSLQTQLMSCR